MLIADATDYGTWLHVDTDPC